MRRPIDSRANAWLTEVFSALSSDGMEGFSGLGLILYHPPLALPVLPLVWNGNALPLPTEDVEGSIALLRQLCRPDSPFHDGFHLVDAQSLKLTHASQFFAPPIPDVRPEGMSNRAVGARFMAAWIGSLLPTVAMTAILSQCEGGVMFERGVAHPILVPEQ